MAGLLATIQLIQKREKVQNIHARRTYVQSFLPKSRIGALRRPKTHTGQTQGSNPGLWALYDSTPEITGGTDLKAYATETATRSKGRRIKSILEGSEEAAGRLPLRVLTRELRMSRIFPRWCRRPLRRGRSFQPYRPRGVNSRAV